MPPQSLQVPPSTSLTGAAGSRSSSEVYPGIWKASAFPAANICPIYTRGQRASSSMGTAAHQGPNRVPDKELKSMLCLVTRQRWHPGNQFGPGGGFLSGPFFQFSCVYRCLHICDGGVSQVSPLGTQGDCLYTTSLGLSCPRNHTLTPCPLPELGLPPQDSGHPSQASTNPLTQHVNPIPGTASTRGQPTRDTHLGTDEFLNELCLSKFFQKVRQPFTTSQKV